MLLCDRPCWEWWDAEWGGPRGGMDEMGFSYADVGFFRALECYDEFDGYV